MKKKTALVLIIQMLMAMVLIIFSKQARQGAADGLTLAENTIIPSLAPLLIIFLLIMKTGAKDLLARAFGFISVHVFNLPQITFPAIFFGLIGGYPMGALLTNELLKSGDIDEKQARRLLRFNFCGGCGFIITAVGTTVLNNTKARRSFVSFKCYKLCNNRIRFVFYRKKKKCSLLLIYRIQKIG